MRILQTIGRAQHVFALWMLCTIVPTPASLVSAISESDAVIIRVDVVCDAKNPPRQQTIHRILSNSAVQLKAAINVQLVQQSYEQLDGLLSTHPDTLVEFLKPTRHKRTGNLTVVFTNDTASTYEEQRCTDPTCLVEVHYVKKNWLGYCLGMHHIIVLYDCDRTMSWYSEVGHEDMGIIVMNHEVGHLLGLLHDPDPNSIMYEYCDVSKGQWTSYNQSILDTTKTIYVLTRGFIGE